VIGSNACLVAVTACAFAALSAIAVAQDRKMSDGPRITAVAPFTLTPGQPTTLHVRGLKLDTATGVLVQPTTAGLVVQMGEAKKSPPPNGAEAKKYGDTEVEVKLTAVPSSAPLQLIVETVAGRTPPVLLPVVAASDSIEEKEPNGAFREAQPIGFDKIVRGCINTDKDVDVFRFEGKRGMQITVVAQAPRWPSLLDPMLTLFSASGQIVAFGVTRPSFKETPAPGFAAGIDPYRTSRGNPWADADCRIAVTLPGDGPYLVSVYDAQDTGGPWHCYHLTVKENR
jgi:hypothetical protein